MFILESCQVRPIQNSGPCCVHVWMTLQRPPAAFAVPAGACHHLPRLPFPPAGRCSKTLAGGRAPAKACNAACGMNQSPQTQRGRSKQVLDPSVETSSSRAEGGNKRVHQVADKAYVKAVRQQPAGPNLSRWRS